MIRLSTAHAKARLSPEVEEKDAIEAERIMRYALFKEVPKRQRKKKRKPNAGTGGRGGQGDGEDSEDESDDESGDEPNAPGRMEMPQGANGTTAPTTAAAKTNQQPPEDPIWGDDSQDTQDVPMDISEPGPSSFVEGQGIPGDRYVYGAISEKVGFLPFRTLFSLLGLLSSDNG